ncbi:hypothetical protein Y032_0047g1431 [Ancylostoma ceylanicum]|uniref:Uncharacterized protein n=1 Tax=Ancylostoma ceylanicum TaxID=53326 RepID=A0A016UCJ8_9BILA|nr:hypothetical protein Y032_0047g1431 [Ancylostoma ceylanicum]
MCFSNIAGLLDTCLQCGHLLDPGTRRITLQVLVSLQQQRSPNSVRSRRETLTGLLPSCRDPSLNCCSSFSPYSSSGRRMTAIQGRMAGAGTRCC